MIFLNIQITNKLLSKSGQQSKGGFNCGKTFFEGLEIPVS